jgi:tetratricopeptide (TPR) repeat protein
MQAADPPPDDAVAHYKRGNAHKDAGEPQAALKSYNRALELNPGYAHALCNRGVVLASLRRLDEALASYDRALALDPRDSITHHNRGVLLHEQKDWNGALQSYDLAIQFDPGRFHAHFNRGLVQRELQQWDAALASFDRAIAINPEIPAPYFNRGVLQQQRRQFAAALQSYDKAAALHPGLYQAFFKSGSVYQELKDLDKALASYDLAIAIRKEYPEAWLNRGVVLHDLRRFDEALASYDQAIALKPSYAEAWFNRGTLQKEADQWDAAIASFDRAIEIRSEYAEAWCGRGAALAQAHQMDEALSSYDRAIALRPDFAEAQYNRSLALLQAGNYAAGWPAYEWRWKNAARLFMGAPRAFREPLWLGGDDLAGKRILIFCEQGLGDTLQYCRYVNLVADLGAEVIFEVQAPLVSLLARLPGVSRVLTAGSALPPFDCQCPLLSLPLAFKTTLQNVPATTPYIYADPDRVALWQSRLGARTRPRIGLVCTGSKGYGNDKNRSIALAEWAARLPRDFDYVCLQKEYRDADLAALQANPWIANYAAEQKDFSDAAALVEAMDLVISVDTAVAHLAGAMGKPTWRLLPVTSDWRWMLDREDSPWYPSLRLYRQQEVGDWSGVFARFTADLLREFA